MTGERVIRAEFRGTLGEFALAAGFIAPGAGVTALFGPSGCGKTTVLRCIAGLTRLADGLCVVDGDVWQDRDGTFLPTYRRALGYVFQEASLFPHLSVRKNLLFGAPKSVAALDSPSKDGRPAGRPMERVGAVHSRSGDGRLFGRLLARAHKDGAPTIAFDEVADLLGVTPLLDRSPRNLSGGERQRVAIGRALLSQPKLLLMDEPLAALDQAAKAEILPFLERLRDRRLIPIVYVTHDLAEVERLADQVVLMEKGRVLASGALADLQSDPGLPLAIARDAAVTLEVVVEAYDAAYGLLTLAARGARFTAPAAAAPIGDSRRIRVVAGDVSLAREAPGRSSILNVLPGRILATRLIDPNLVVAVVGLGNDGAGARLLARVTRKSWEQLGLAVGGAVFAQVKAVALAPARD